jgi:hypothetical protein
MIRGKLERICSDGRIEGWAFDTEAPETIPAVQVRSADGRALGEGLAFLFRDRLADAGLGLGWCGFSIRPTLPQIGLRTSLSLHERGNGAALDHAEALPVVAAEDEDRELDPFAAPTWASLRGCAEVFERYLQAAGPAAFVRVAHIYTLGRRAEPETVALDADTIVSGVMTPLQLLERLVGSDEFQREPRRLAGPRAEDFPFFGAAYVG